MLRGLEAAESDAVLLAPSEDAVAKERTGALLQIEIMSRAELEDCPQWQHLYAHERKDCAKSSKVHGRFHPRCTGVFIEGAHPFS